MFSLVAILWHLCITFQYWPGPLTPQTTPHVHMGLHQSCQPPAPHVSTPSQLPGQEFCTFFSSFSSPLSLWKRPFFYVFNYHPHRDKLQVLTHVPHSFFLKFQICLFNWWLDKFSLLSLHCKGEMSQTYFSFLFFWLIDYHQSQSPL